MRSCLPLRRRPKEILHNGRRIPSRVELHALTLIELLVALLIISVGATLLMHLIWRGARESSDAHRRNMAALLAQERMETILNTPATLLEMLATPSSGEYQPFCDAGGKTIHPAFRWRASARQVPEREGLAQVIVEVQWERSHTPRLGGPVRLVTLRRLPKSVKPVAGQELVRPSAHGESGVAWKEERP